MFSTTGKTSVALSIAALIGTMGLTSAPKLNAQEPNPTTVAPGAKSGDVIAQGKDGVYIYHVKVVERALDAVN